MVLVRMEEHVLITKTATHVYVLMALKAIRVTVNTIVVLLQLLCLSGRDSGVWVRVGGRGEKLD